MHQNLFQNCIGLSDFQRELQERLGGVSDTAQLDAQVLLAHVLGVKRSWVMAHPEATLTREQKVQLISLTVRLLAGEPLPYVLGHWEFFGLELLLNPAVLIPRPETELLVEYALGWLKSLPRRVWKKPERISAVDLGTGSGCIAIALAKNLPNLKIVACDLSWQAIQLAKKNVVRHELSSQVYLVQSNLLSSFRSYPTTEPGDFSLICANLPYIPSAKLTTLSVATSEPLLALDGGEDGLDLIRRLLSQAHKCLSRPGLLLVEIEATQGQQASELAEAYFPQANVMVKPDLAKRDRLIVIEQLG